MNATPKQHARLLKLLAVGVALVLWAGVAWLAGPVGALILTAAFLAGLMLIPLPVVLLGPSLPGPLRPVIGTISWIQMALVYGEYVLDWDRGEYDCRIVQDGHVLREDGWHPLEDADGWSRLGLRPFGVTWRKRGQSLREFGAERAADAVTDGGVLDEIRGGELLYTDHDDARGWLVPVYRITERARAFGSIGVLGRARDHALETYGGDNGDIVTRWFVGGIVGCLFLGVLTSYLAFGVL